MTRSATVSKTLDNLPIAARMTPQNQHKATPSPGLALGHSRSLTISNSDPTTPRSPMGHVRSKTIDSPRSTEYREEDLPDYSLTGRPVRPKIIIPSSGEWDSSGQNGRYPQFKDRRRLQPPSAYSSVKSTPSRSDSQDRQSPDTTKPRQSEYPSPNIQTYSTPEILQTPNDQFAGLDIYDDYHSSTAVPDLVGDVDLPYTAIGQAFTGISPIRQKPIQQIISRSTSNGAMPQRSDTTQSRRAVGQGLVLTVEDQVQSPISIGMDLTKIRIKVSYWSEWTELTIGPYWKSYKRNVDPSKRNLSRSYR